MSARGRRTRGGIVVRALVIAAAFVLGIAVGGALGDGPGTSEPTTIVRTLTIQTVPG